MSSNKHVAKIYLNYENMEGVDIPLKFIGRFYLNNITQRIARWHIGAPDLYNCVDKFFIEIDRSFDKEKLGQAENYKAITSISIEFEDGEEARYLVSWGDEDFINTCQLTRFNKHGDLFIAISEDPDWNENAMDEERINADNFKLRTIQVYDEMGYPEELPEELIVDPKPLSTTIEEMDFSVRTYNCLKRASLNTLDDLSKVTEEDLVRVRNLGRRSVEEVMKKCAQMGVTITRVFGI